MSQCVFPNQNNPIFNYFPDNKTLIIYVTNSYSYQQTRCGRQPTSGYGYFYYEVMKNNYYIIKNVDNDTYFELFFMIIEELNGKTIRDDRLITTKQIELIEIKNANDLIDNQLTDSYVLFRFGKLIHCSDDEIYNYITKFKLKTCHVPIKHKTDKLSKRLYDNGYVYSHINDVYSKIIN